MAQEPSAAQKMIGDVAPKLADLTDTVLFGDIWERPGLSPRDRSLVTVTTLVAPYRNDQLSFHLRLALQNGLSAEELVEAITHLAFYAGWPNAMGRCRGPQIRPGRERRHPVMKTIFVTGAGRGLGADIARRALAAGHQVVATGRHPETVAEAFGGERDNLLVTALDITDLANAGGRRPPGDRPFRSYRRVDQQRRQLLCRVLRGDLPSPDAPADRNEPLRPDERHPRRAAVHA